MKELVCFNSTVQFKHTPMVICKANVFLILSICPAAYAILAYRLKHPTDEGVIPERSRTNKTEHFLMNIFHIEGLL